MSLDTRLPGYPVGASPLGACAGTRRVQFFPRLPRHHRGFICKAEPKQTIRVCCCAYGFGFHCLGTCCVAVIVVGEIPTWGGVDPGYFSRRKAEGGGAAAMGEHEHPQLLKGS